MADQRDRTLVEAAQIQRRRLASALLYGRIDERRTVADYTRRLVVSLVLAAVVAAGCVGTAFVSSLLRSGFSLTGTTTASSTPTAGNTP